MREYLCFGIIGNFPNHLNQAGEAKDFASTSDVDTPKGLFPFYVPNCDSFLGRYCIDNDVIIIPNDNKNYNVQAEPEICLECDVSYDSGKVAALNPKFFFAFNDVSIRNYDGAAKLSQKKNFSKASKGCGCKISIDKFDNGGVCDNFSLTSFLLFDEELHQYGDNAKLVDYTYFYKKLIYWTIEQLNTQTDKFVLENLINIIKRSNYPSKILIAAGATSYTNIGEERFLQNGDEICIVSYNHNQYSNEDIKNLIKNGAKKIEGASVVRQKVLIK